MIRPNRLSVPVLLLAAMVATGCSTIPTEEIAAADEALKQAQTAEAPVYASESWAAAEAAHTELQTEIEAQQQAWAITRSYDRAKTLAADARTAAEKATGEAAAGKQRAANEASASIEKAQALLREVEQMVEHAPQGKGTMADVAALRADTGAMAGSLEAAQSAYDAGRFADAQTQALAAIGELERIRAQIEGAQSSQRSS